MEEQQVNASHGSLPEGESDASGANAGQIQVPQGLDDLLDEIEDLVASDAQSFVQGFVQKGGQ